MELIIVLVNVVVTIAAGLGIYSFSGSAVWAIIGAIVLTGGLRASPILALLAYPSVEYLLGNGLTVYSAIIVGATLLQLGFAFGLASGHSPN